MTMPLKFSPFLNFGSMRVLVSGSRVRRAANETPLVLLSIEGNLGARVMPS